MLNQINITGPPVTDYWHRLCSFFPLSVCLSLIKRLTILQEWSEEVYLSSTSGTCVFDRALCSGWREPFVSLQLAASREVQPGNNHHSEAAPSPCSHACSRQPPTQVTWAPSRAPQSTWPAKIPPHMGPVRSPHLDMSCHLPPASLCGDNADQSLQERLNCLLQTGEIKFIITSVPELWQHKTITAHTSHINLK